MRNQNIYAIFLNISEEIKIYMLYFLIAKYKRMSSVPLFFFFFGGGGGGDTRYS